MSAPLPKPPSDAHGAYLDARAVTTCPICETRRKRMGGRECFECWRAANGHAVPTVSIAVPEVKRPPKRARKPTDTEADRTRRRRRVLGCGDVSAAEVDRLWGLR